MPPVAVSNTLRIWEFGDSASYSEWPESGRRGDRSLPMLEVLPMSGRSRGRRKHRCQKNVHSHENSRNAVFMRWVKATPFMDDSTDLT